MAARQKALHGMAEVKDRSKARKNKVIVIFKAENKGTVKGKAKSMKKKNGTVRRKALHGMAEVKDRSKARKNKVIVKFKAENKGTVKGKAKSKKKIMERHSKRHGMARQKAWNGMVEGKVRPKERKNKGIVKFKAENKGAAKGKAKSILKKWHSMAKDTARHGGS